MPAFSAVWRLTKLARQGRGVTHGCAMDNLKPFDPDEIDETLTRVVTHGRDTYLLFPFINATGSAPKFNSISCVIKGKAATVEDFHALSGLVAQAGAHASWAISFNTPWLLPSAQAVNVNPRGLHGRAARK
jgi:hypothetical protein